MAQQQSWRTSSYSGAVGNCVEVGSTLRRIRDSKNRTGPVLTGNVSALIAACREGALR